MPPTRCAAASLAPVARLTYASELIQCGHCGHPLTSEQKTRQTKSGERYYNYYCGTYYNVPGHPRVRVTEADLDKQVLAVFAKLRLEDEQVRDWFRLVLASQTRDTQADSRPKCEGWVSHGGV